MAKIFIAGSRRLSQLNKNFRKRLDNIMDKHFTVLVGDANGVDRAVQQYLARQHYQKVVVFCMEGKHRNNLGHWPIRAILAPNESGRNFAYYSTKDRAMVEEADYGLMLWDGRSHGTLRSIIDMVRRKKPVVVYVASTKSFYTLRDQEELAGIFAQFDRRVIRQLDVQLQTMDATENSPRKQMAMPLF